MENQTYDLIVIGSGPGGYPAAIKASQMGKKVALIEAKELGGTCLNRGCIPSKALIAGAEILNKIKKASEFGIEVGEIKIDYAKMVKRKDSVVDQIRKGLKGLILANKVTIIKGYAEFIDKKKIKVSGENEGIYEASQFILAMGSEPRNIFNFPFDGKKIHNSTTLLELTTLPKSLAIIGGGVIGCEFASLFNELGVEVTVIEMLPSLIATESQSLSNFLKKSFISKNIKVELNQTVEAIDLSEEGIIVRLKNSKAIHASMALVAVGRQMNTDKVGLSLTGVKVDEKGNIQVNSKMETNIEGIYAIGDLASKWWLAHVATHQGLIAATNASSKNDDEIVSMHYDAIPSVIFTHPELASVGLSLEQAQAKGIDAKIGVFPFQALGKSQAANETEGFAQVVIDKKTGQILGAQVAGSDASSLIAVMGIAVANELTLSCLTDTIQAHPTLPEAWLEAGLIAAETPLHLPPKR